MFIITYKKVFVLISLALVTISVGAMLFFGLPLGIEFKGGALTEVTYTGSRPAVEAVQDILSRQSIGTVHVQPIGEDGYVIKTRALSESERQAVLQSLTIDKASPAQEKNFTSIGPSVGRELARKAVISIILVALGIVFFIAYAFRKVTRPVSSWKYGIIAIMTLLHDVVIAVGVFAVLAHVYGIEIDTLFVVAVLTILGLSVSDTIVVFDRIRENVREGTYKTFTETVGRSIEQAFTRSINTSVTVILALLALFFFGPASTKVFALTLTAGMFFGTYSSIFLASPLLVYAEQLQGNKKS